MPMLVVQDVCVCVLMHAFENISQESKRTLLLTIAHLDVFYL